jgi:diguanylate cyclase (GGDEF)-like protein
MKAVKSISTMDVLSIVALISIACFISTLCVVAAGNPHSRTLMLNLLAGLGAGGLILFRQFRKTTIRIQISEARANYALSHDALTRLPNKTLFLEMLAAVFRGKLSNEVEGHAVLCIAIDRFEDLSGALGFCAGDEILQEIATRLASVCREQDKLARIGDDAFALLWSGATLEKTQIAAAQLIKLLSAPYKLSVGQASLTCSIGINLTRPEPGQPAEVLRRAALALSIAKTRGGGGFQVFDEAMDLDLKARQGLEVDLRRALSPQGLAKGELSLVYQPQINAKGAIVGVEALMRWTCEARGSVSPSVFIPLAESCGLSEAIGLFALRRAFMDSRRWPGLKVAVNISATQIRSAALIPALKNLIAECDINPRNFELELTESVLLSDDATTFETLNAIRRLGFTLALDDFGTGYSSLSYLRRLPVDKIKIDRSFITHLGHRLESDAIVKAIVTLADTLGLKVIAEGVETQNQVDRLAIAGCGNIQGFFFSRPLHPDDIDDMVASKIKLAA